MRLLGGRFSGSRRGMAQLLSHEWIKRFDSFPPIMSALTESSRIILIRLGPAEQQFTRKRLVMQGGWFLP